MSAESEYKLMDKLAKERVDHLEVDMQIRRLCGRVLSPVELAGTTSELLSALGRKLEQLQRTELLHRQLKSVAPELARDTLEMLVRIAYEAEEITTSRAAEILQVSVMDIRERGWLQGRYTETENL